MTKSTKFINFVSESSIHGVKFILNRKSHVLWRILWLVFFLLSVLALIFYSHDVFDKFCNNPDLNVKILQVPMDTIPFPAITVCSPVIAKKDHVNINDVILKSFDNPKEITEEEKKYFTAIMNACSGTYGHIVNNLAENLTDFDNVDLLKEVAVGNSEIFDECYMKDKCHDYFCNNSYDCHDILTDRGFCYIANIQSADRIYNTDIISDELKYESAYEFDSIWTNDRGFADESSKGNALHARKNTYFIASMLLKKGKSNYCMKYGNSFTFNLHKPNEVPTIFHNVFSVHNGYEKHVVLSAISYKAEKSLRSYSPKARNCYFEDEKSLKFFNTYTRNLCDLECLTNYTLKTCGCVHFSMPRDNTTKVCKDLTCYVEATKSWPTQLDEKLKAPCGCLKTCNDIEYSIKYEIVSMTDQYNELISQMSGGNESSDASRTELSFHFNDHMVLQYETYVAYRLQNLIAEIGGLLGLFLGCSLLSLIEIIYYLYEIFSEKRSEEGCSRRDSKEAETKDFGAIELGKIEQA